MQPLRQHGKNDCVSETYKLGLPATPASVCAATTATVHEMICRAGQVRDCQAVIERETKEQVRVAWAYSQMYTVQVPSIRIPSSQVRDFQAIIGRETKEQCRAAWGGLPDVLLACVGGGSNAIGLFHDFVVRIHCSFKSSTSKSECAKSGSNTILFMTLWRGSSPLSSASQNSTSTLQKRCWRTFAAAAMSSLCCRP